MDVKGQIELPDCETMRAAVRRSKAVHEARFTPSVRQYIDDDWIAYLDDLGRLVGCVPPSFCQLLF